MEKLQLGKRVEIMINGDPERVIRFSTEDVHLRGRIYDLAKETKRKETEMNQRISEIEPLEGKDELGFPLRDVAAQNLTIEIADFFMAEIDKAFGEGTSAKVFADGFDFESMVLFLEFTTSKFEAVGSKKVDERLIKSKSTGSKKVMK